jgi:hypothetical protein
MSPRANAHIVGPFQPLLAQGKARVILRTRILRPKDLNLRVLSGCRARLLRRAVGFSIPILEG